MTLTTAADQEELESFLDDEENAILRRDLRKVAPKPKGKPAPRAWRERIPVLFPRSASVSFADRHEAFWSWENAIELTSAPDPFCAFWPRGGAKSTSAEMAVTDLGCRGKRRYALYVRMTQDKADDSVQNIAALFESHEIELHYPEHAKRSVGKFGSARGWRRNRVWTAGGFVVDALGLDTASRGVKLEEQRPDLIVFDDIDGLDDNAGTTMKKIGIITKSILPAGANNVAVLFIQNLIIRDGVASQLADGRADFLAKRIVSGPFPALSGLLYEWHLDPETGIRRATITAGKPTWEGQSLEACQRFIDTWGLSAFLKEAQHRVKEKAEGVCLDFDPAVHYVELDHDEVLKLAKRSRAFGGLDFGAWRFGCTLWFMTPIGVVIRIDEVFSQRETLGVRARKIHEMCVRNGIADPSPKTCPLWGDSANPQDIMEINLAFANGWTDEETGKHVTSKLRVVAVGAGGKLRRVAVERMNDALEQRTLRFLKSAGQGAKWKLGMNAREPGTEMTGSRLMWEIDNWAVPVPKPGEAQDDNPDDDTADGSDMVASARYALMSWWGPVLEPGADAETVENDRAWEFDPKTRAFREPKHAADPLLMIHSDRRRPAVRGPRPRLGGR